MALETRTTARRNAAMRRQALMDTTDQMTQLRKTLGKRKKAELIEAMIELAKNDRSVLWGLQMRFDAHASDAAGSKELTRATRQAIVDNPKFLTAQPSARKNRVQSYNLSLSN